MATNTSSSKGGGDEGEIDVEALLKERDRIKTLMRRDPRFITRLITQLDKHMHKMMHEKQQRVEAIKADEAEVERVEATIRSHIEPNVARLTAALAEKRARRAALAAALAAQADGVGDLQRAAAALVGRARHASGRLISKTASDRLAEARGFSASVPTTQLIAARTGKPKQPPPPPPLGR